jgi:hypothetical protein
VKEPLSPPEVRKLLLRILATGEVRFTSHALAEMAKDGVTTQDVEAVLRGGVVEPGELEKGTWRYRLRAGGVYVVVTFRSETMAVVVTAWRTK